MTTQATHTKGPWTATHDATSKTAVYRIEGGNHHVASIRGDKAASHFRAEEANAHLIAAAPELLEALKVTAWSLLKHQPPRAPQDPSTDASHALSIASAAISKAEGRAE